MTIDDGSQSHRLCGMYENITITSIGNDLGVTFESDISRNKKGFAATLFQGTYVYQIN